MIAVMLNPSSGLTRRPRLRAEVDELFRNAGMDARIHELADPRAIPLESRRALAERPEAIVAGGGDGTVSAVASVLAGTTTPLGVLPLGSLNHFAKDAGIPLDLHKAVETVAARHVRRVDVGRVNDRIFVNNASIGVYPSVVESRERLRSQGRSKWAALVLATVDVLQSDSEVTIRLEDDRARVLTRTPFVFVGNNEYLAEGLRLGARTRLEAGRLWTYFAPPVKTRHLPRLFAHALFGLALREHALQSTAGSEFWIDTAAPAINVASDGELLTLTTPLHFRSWPGALALFVPAS
jgi:diacylglycerol kinase family enzyme